MTEVALIVTVLALAAFQIISAQRREAELMRHVDRLENKLLAITNRASLAAYQAGEIVSGNDELRSVRRDDATEAALEAAQFDASGLLGGN